MEKRIGGEGGTPAHHRRHNWPETPADKRNSDDEICRFGEAFQGGEKEGRGRSGEAIYRRSVTWGRGLGSRKSAMDGGCVGLGWNSIQRKRRRLTGGSGMSAKQRGRFRTDSVCPGMGHGPKMRPGQKASFRPFSYFLISFSFLFLVF
jgi:hypothetical protein